MCGIVGALDLSGQRKFAPYRLAAMLQAISHRGPDDTQTHDEDGLSLGANRLAIMDPANGRQPFANTAKNIWSVVNGEIFNFNELRKILIASEHHLKTHCDAELWPYLYEKFHENLFHHVKGQFAVSIWDQKKQTLLLGRDRLGICPLYYTIQDGWLLWASEVKALLSSGLVKAIPDRKGIDHLFNFQCSSTERSFFEGIKMLPPGHFITVKNGNLNLHQYWNLDFPDAGEERRVSDPQILIDEFDDLLKKSVNSRLQSDVPIVSYLSGGIDSTLILTLTKVTRGQALPSFAISLDKIGTDEGKHAAETAALVGSPLTLLRLNSQQIADSFPELILANEGPLLDTSCAAMMQLAAEVNKQGYKVVLTGEGADEALAGYIWFKTHKLGRLMNQWLGASVSKFLRKWLTYTIYPKKRRCMPSLETVFNGVRPAQQSMYEIMSLARDMFYSEEMWSHLIDHNPYADLRIDHVRMERWDPLNQSLYIGYKMMLAGLLMVSKGDRIAMHSSVETRYPYLDEDVVNFCASIAPSYKLYGMKEKWLLREVAKKYLPKSIAQRPKTMFRTKLFKLFTGPHKPAWVSQLLSEESIRKSGFFDPKRVSSVYHNAHKPLLLPHQFIYDAALIYILTTQLWFHLFCGGGLCDLPVWKPPQDFSQK